MHKLHSDSRDTTRVPITRAGRSFELQNDDDGAGVALRVHSEEGGGSIPSTCSEWTGHRAGALGAGPLGPGQAESVMSEGRRALHGRTWTRPGRRRRLRGLGAGLAQWDVGVDVEKGDRREAGPTSGAVMAFTGTACKEN